MLKACKERSDTIWLKKYRRRIGSLWQALGRGGPRHRVCLARVRKCYWLLVCRTKFLFPRAKFTVKASQFRSQTYILNDSTEHSSFTILQVLRCSGFIKMKSIGKLWNSSLSIMVSNRTIARSHLLFTTDFIYKHCVSIVIWLFFPTLFFLSWNPVGIGRYSGASSYRQAA